MNAHPQCQHNANCGGYCETPEEAEFALCESCLDAYHEREKKRVKDAAIRDLMRDMVKTLSEITALIDRANALLK